MALDSLHSIAVFVRVAETGSFTAAARRLGISPSGASKSLSRLEEKVGMRLVMRTTRRTHLTDEGRVLLEQCRQVLAEVEEAESMLLQRLGKPGGRVRLQMPVGYGRRVIMPLMVELADRYPNLVVDIEMSDRTADVGEEGLDAVIRIGDPTDNRLVARRLESIRFLTVASPGYVRRHGAPRTPEDLAEHHCLAYYVPITGRYRDWEFALPTGEVFSRAFPGRLNVNNAQALMQAAIDGVGIASVATFIASDAVRRGELQVLLRDYPSIGPMLWLQYAERRYQSPRVRALVDFLLERVPVAMREHDVG